MLKAIVGMFKGAPSCRGASDFLLDYVEGRLEEKLAQKFELHMAACPNCTRYLDQYREMLSMLKDIPAPSPPPALEAETRRFLEDALVKENQRQK